MNPPALEFKDDDPDKSVAGRVTYLLSLGWYCQGFWESLRDEVLRPCEYFALVASDQPVAAKVQEIAQAAFDQWLWAWIIEDEWIVTAAHHTLTSWAMIQLRLGAAALDVYPLLPFFGPSQVNLQSALETFSPIFQDAYLLSLEKLSAEQRQIISENPVGLRMFEAAAKRESVSSFKKRMRSQFAEQLREYVAQRQKRILEQKNTDRDAAWTALYQCGRKSPKFIESWEADRSGGSYTHIRIMQVVKEFADSIGLTLRAPKAGPRAKGRKIRPNIAPGEEI